MNKEEGEKKLDKQEKPFGENRCAVKEKRGFCPGEPPQTPMTLTEVWARRNKQESTE